MKGIAIHSCTETKCLRLLSDTTEKSAWGEIWFMKNINVEIVKAGTLEPLQNFPGTAFIDETNYRITVAGKNKAGKRTETVIDLSDLFVKTYTYEK